MRSIVLSFSYSVIIRVLFNVLRIIRLNETKFCIHIIIDKNNSMYVGIVKYRYSQICNRVTGMIRLNETKFCIHIIIDKNNSMYVGIVKYRYSQICNRVTALDFCQNLVFAQYLENKKTE